MRAEEYTGEPVSVRTFQALIAALLSLQYVAHVKGKKYVTKVAFADDYKVYPSGGVAAHFLALSPLLRLAHQFGITGANVDAHFLVPLPANPITLKTASSGKGRRKVPPKRMRYVATAEVDALKAEMTTLNVFLDSFPIQGAKHRGYWRIFNEGDVAKPYGWNKGGRLYGLKGSYQNEKKPVRSAMLIGGRPVVEIDVNASYLTILHGLAKLPFDTESDPYDVGIDRDAVKMWTVATLGHTRHHVRWPAKLSEDYFEAHGCKISDVASVKHIRDLMIAKHPLLAGWATSSTTWADLMFAESKAMLGSMNELMRKGKPSLCVHDSLIVRLEDQQAAEEALGRNYQLVCGISPGLKVSPPATRGAP